MNSYYYQTAMDLLKRKTPLAYTRPFVHVQTEPLIMGETQTYGYTLIDVIRDIIKWFKKKPDGKKKLKPGEVRLPKTKAKIPMPKPEIFTTYSGADVVIKYDNKVVGEMSSIYFNKATPEIVKYLTGCTPNLYADIDMLNEYPVTVVGTMTVFKEWPKFMEAEDDLTMDIFYANQYGHKSKQEITGLKGLFIEGGISIDDCTTELLVVMCAKDITPMKATEEAICNESAK